MEEENNIEKENNQEAKKRGRPKKDDTTSDNAIEEELRAIREKLAKLDDIEYKLEEQRKVDENSRLNESPLVDKAPYPSEEEKAMLEDRTDEHRDFTLPDTKKNELFLKKIFKKKEMKGDNMVAVLLLHPTTDATLHYIETEKDGTFRIEEEIYHTNEHCIYSLKINKERYPLCILPTWSMIPIGTRAWFELSQERRGHELERMILNAIKKEEILKEDDGKKKGKMSGKTLWIIIGVIVLGYFLLKSGAVKF